MTYTLAYYEVTKVIIGQVTANNILDLADKCKLLLLENNLLSAKYNGMLFFNDCNVLYCQDSLSKPEYKFIPMVYIDSIS